MSKFTAEELNRHVLIGGIAAGIGLLTAISAHVARNAASGWVDHFRCLEGVGLVILLTGLAWAGIALLYRYTHFFALDRPLDSGVFGLQVGVILVVSVVVLIAFGMGLPTTPADRMPPDPKLRAQVVKEERVQKATVSVAVLMTGGVFVFFPLHRFLKR